ncbi:MULTISPECIES: WhiB family transcriptional regulator [Dietzia]|uniref:Transcriptional regulator WhiB n=1 Tax=Dietzia cinnamea TaxID=321318 RepID=A0A177LC43_9ACTN|nr:MULTISPECIES: WhiB family transcriptional regulator [Dietzia]EFV90094.1 transcription factor WhiB [Dietzia cinnamea P4]MBB1022543.1 WhiB family transcriptional regulator [Dietzia sp. E1]AVM63448.1 WhiB family transcriptional regulator [Dietzia sp. oral taxon 368]MBM7231284.1 WhiB family transcriptional regulator [Dietzia cinnamea]MCT1639907.1 WhiB family transcriptional regulator [Dietzia cinnamea]
MPRFRNLKPTSEFWAWRDDGACVGDPDLFYSAEDEPKGVRRRKEKAAKEICARCPVLETCRKFAIEAGELYGVWGGMTELDRHKLAGRQRTG